MTTDLPQDSQAEVNWLRINDLQDDILGMTVDELTVLHAAGQELVAGNVQLGQSLPAKVVTGGAFRCQHQNDVMVGSVHAVEIRKVKVGVRAKKALGGRLETIAAVRGVLGRLAGVELGITAEKDAVEHATGG